MNNYFDFYKSIMDTQKNMMESFTSMMPKAPAANTTDDVFKNYENWMKGQQSMLDYTKQFMDGAANWPLVNPLEAWEKAMNMLNPLEVSKSLGLDESRVFEKVLNANKFYLAMYNFYDDLNNHYIAPAVGEVDRIVEESIGNFDKMFRESMLPLLPDELKPFVENPYNFSKTVVEVTSNFYSPWKETYPEMTEMLLQSPMSTEKLREYVKLWKENYDQTVGALMKSPVVGSNRETIEQQNKAVDAMVDMILTTSEYLGSIATITNENGRKSIEEWMTMSKEDIEPKSFKEFYDYWTGKLEGEIEKYFYTDEFAVLMGKTTDSVMRFKIESDKVVENMLADTPIVTRGQVDSLYKTVYDLKKEVRSLKKQLAATEKVEKKEVKK